MANYGEIPGGTGVRAYYKFEGNLTDSGPNGYNLGNTGSVSYAGGKVGANSITLNSGSAYVNNNLGIDGGVTTMCCWALCDTNPTNGGDRAFMLNQRGSVTDVQYDLLYSQASGTYRFEFRRTKAGVAVQEVLLNPYQLTLNIWYHFCMTYDATNIRAYINGALVGTQAASGNGTGLGDSFYVGAQPTGTGEFWKGEIDEVIVCSRAWSAAEIKRYYSLVKGGLVPRIS